MGLYRRIPTQTDANQYTGGREPVKGICQNSMCYLQNTGIGTHVHTMHDNQVIKVVPGDWILPEPDGIHYFAVKDDFFKVNYEEVKIE